jgi:hypothetical protein
LSITRILESRNTLSFIRFVSVKLVMLSVGKDKSKHRPGEKVLLPYMNSNHTAPEAAMSTAEIKNFTAKLRLPCSQE